MSPLSGPAHLAGQISCSVRMSLPTGAETVTYELEHYSDVSSYLWSSFQHLFSPLTEISEVLKQDLI